MVSNTVVSLAPPAVGLAIVDAATTQKMKRSKEEGKVGNISW